MQGEKYVYIELYLFFYTPRIKFRKKNKNFNNISIGALTNIDNNCSIGDYTYIGLRCTISKANIGRYCSIGNNVSIGPGEHHINWISTSSYLYEDKVDWYEELTHGDVIIGNDVWIGTDSIVRRGITVGDGAVIGANSFVNSDVPPYAIVAGIPAKIIKYRFSEEVIQKLLDSKWFLLDLDDAKELVRKLEKEI